MRNLRKKGMAGLIKCVSFQDSLKGRRFYIYNSLLDYWARTCRNGKEYLQHQAFAFQCWLTEAVNIPLFKGGELSGQWAGRKVFKIRWLTDNGCSPTLLTSGTAHHYQNQVVFVPRTTEKKQHLPRSGEQLLRLWSLEHLSAGLEII